MYSQLLTNGVPKSSLAAKADATGRRTCFPYQQEERGLPGYQVSWLGGGVYLISWFQQPMC